MIYLLRTVIYLELFIQAVPRSRKFVSKKMAEVKDIGKRLTAFVNFPSQYTQNLLLSALTSTLPSLAITTHPAESTEECPQLQWADYDLLYIDDIMSHPQDRLISSYIYRKTLIRKHMLHNSIQEYLAKQRHRGVPSLLEESIPRGWVIDIQFADELDELMMDELYDLKDDLDANLEVEDVSERKSV
jgi:tubulin--tyrosine ligase